MKNIIKTIAIPMLLGAALLSSCSGSSLTNEKKVEKIDFETAILKTKENTTSNRCEIKGSNVVNEGKEQKFDYTASLSWDSVKKGWVSPSTEYGITPVHIAVKYLSISVLIAEWGVGDKVEYYTADNGYHLKLDATKDNATTGIKSTFNLDFTWNECGYPIIEKYSLVAEYSGLKNKEITEASYSYSKVS